MKPITREDCELMWVWDGDYDSGYVIKYKFLVVAVFDNGSCLAIDPDGRFEALYFNEYDHCAPIEKAKVKKWVPCECREDLPEGFFGGWVRSWKTGLRIMVVGYSIVAKRVILGDGCELFFDSLFENYEWSPTFDGPYQPIGKLVEVDGE